MPRKLDNKDKGEGVPAPRHVTFGQCTGQPHVSADFTPLAIPRGTQQTEAADCTSIWRSKYIVGPLTEIQTRYFGRLTRTAVTLPMVAQGSVGLFDAY